LTEYKNNCILHIESKKKPNRKKVKIIRKIKNNQLDKKYIDDEELEKEYIENDDDNPNNNICPNFILNIIKKEWDVSYGGKIYGEFPASTCKLIKPQKDKPVIVSCCGYVKDCDKNKLEKKNKDKENKNDSKIALEIEKVKKNQKQKKEEGE